jgi:cell division protein FtsI/penicillin-binding protein 2
VGDRIIAIVLALLAVGAVGTALWAVTGREARDPAAEAAAVVDPFLDAWEAGDTATMAELAAEPGADLAAVHDQFRDAVGPTAVRVTRGPVTVQGSQADVELAIAVDLPDADRASWSSRLTARRAEGRWAVRWDPTVLHPELRPGRTWDVLEEPAGRAEILAHDGTPLTAPGELVAVGIEPRRVEDPDALLSEVARLLPEARGTLADLLARDDLQPTWFYPVVTVRPDRWETVARDVRALPGIIVRTEAARIGADDGFALHTLGRVGPADEDRAAALGVEPGVDVGRYGLEAALEDRLTGTPALELVIRDREGDVAARVHRFQGDPPEPMTTTLDPEVQQAVENALVGVSELVGVVVLDAPTGAVRAAASRPLDGFHRAFEGRYPPGSAFKVVTASAVLTAGTGPDDEVACPAETVLGGLRLRNAHGLELGTTTLRRAFAASCNTTFATLATELDPGAVAAAAGRFGFGAELAPGLPAAGGRYPEPADTAERAAAAIGQGRVETSPLHLASVAAAVASGAWRPPFLVEGDEPDASLPLSAAVRDDLADLMRAVVAEGTGAAAAVPGEPPVAGKTGSAEFGSGDPPATHAWFVGFRGDLAFAVLVEGGGEGGAVAAPIAARLLRELDALRG